jgi:peptidoglycan/LPS O-acetylase OafA/YrhL
MKYRSEIDGLRAIAVISVIIYHAEFIISNYIFFPGGYIGVDVFFVISGYLITKIIVNDLNKNRYSIPKFFERRIRRIIPPLFFMFLVILPVSYFLLIPSSLLNFSNALLSSIFFISNLFFYLDGNVYGTQDSLLKPLLHTWSLSVEEQFYIIFPFF